MTTSLGDLTNGTVQPAVVDNYTVTQFYDYANTTTNKYVTSMGINSTSSAQFVTINLRTGIRSASAISAIELSLAAGSFNGGTVLLYGVN